MAWSPLAMLKIEFDQKIHTPLLSYVMPRLPKRFFDSMQYISRKIQALTTGERCPTHHFLKRDASSLRSGKYNFCALT